jgi:hypothetical protein
MAVNVGHVRKAKTARHLAVCVTVACVQTCFSHEDAQRQGTTQMMNDHQQPCCLVPVSYV